MKVLLIHNDNLPEDFFSNNETKKGIEFYSLPISQASDSLQDYDSFLSQQVDELYSLIDPFEPDLIVFPFSLNEINLGELTGIRFAIHIRLDNRNRFAKNKPMLFIGPNSIAECLRIDPIASFLITPGVFTSDVNSKDTLIDWIERNQAYLSPLSAPDYSRFLNKCEIKPPSNYADSHHSIANIWGAAMLSHRVTTDPMPINPATQSFLNSLYFKYIRAQYSIADRDDRSVIEMEASGKKFLLIDDEADKGWDFVLSNYLRLCSLFETIPERIDSYERYSDQYKQLIEKGDYDIVFLDLRLNGPDEEKDTPPSDFSGMSVLKKIKSINPGTQVIMFTASNKSWNLKALLDAGADGYYVKPSPEFYNEGYIDANFQSLSEAIKHCLNRLYLRPLYKRLKKLTELCDESIISPDISDAIKSHLEISFSMLSKANEESQYSYAFMALFGVVEEFVQFFTTTDSDGYLIYYDDLGLGRDVRVGNWLIKQSRFEKEGDAPRGTTFSIAHKVIAIYKEVFKSNMPIGNAKQLINLRDQRNAFVHKKVIDPTYPLLNTPQLNDKKAYELLFNIVEMMLTDCRKLKPPKE